MNKKNKVILIILITFSLSLTINSIYASENTTWEVSCGLQKSDDFHNATYTKTLKSKKLVDYVKKGSKYYEEYLYKYDLTLSCNSSNHRTDLGYGPGPYVKYYSEEETKYIECSPYKIINQGNFYRTIKTINKNGKIYKNYKKTHTIYYANGKYNNSHKYYTKLVGYYKKIKMPSLNVNKVRKTKFLGKTVIYGRWGYEWGVSAMSSKLTKVKASSSKVKHSDYRYWKFSKKPTYFTLYYYK